MNISDESTIINQEEFAAEKENTKTSGEHFWRNVIIGGIPGIMLGSAGTLFAANRASSQSEDLTEQVNAEEVENDVDEIAVLQEEVNTLKEEISDLKDSLQATAIPNIGDSVEVAHSVNDGMSFSEAFASARAEVGAGGIFVWHGDVYGTYYEAEWNGMSAAEKNAFAHTVRHTEYADAYSTGTTADHSTGIAYETHDSASNDEVKVLAQNTVQSEDGQTVNITSIEVEGHYGEVYDLNSDGRPDAAMVDINDDGAPDVALLDQNQDGMISANEVYQVTDNGLVAMNDDPSCNGMPEYTNDPEPGIFV